MEQYSTHLNVRDQYKDNTVEQNKAISLSQSKGFAVATFNLKGDLNLGSIMRSAHLTGAKDFFIFGHRGWDRRSAVGTQNYINVVREDSVNNYLSAASYVFDNGGYRLVVVEQGGKPLFEWLRHQRNWTEFNESKGVKMRPVCFIFGPEEGFPKDFPAEIELDQVGVTRSYNVASAASIILYNYSFLNENLTY